MAHLCRLSLVGAIVLVSACAVRSATANELPTDLCSVLPAADASKILGQVFASPQKSVAPRPFANTNTGTDCNYLSKSGSKLWFRVYVDPSNSAAADLFTRLSQFYGPPTPVKGLGDEAYFDKQHALHVRKAYVRFYINVSPMGTFTPAKEKQIEDLAAAVAGRL